MGKLQQWRLLTFIEHSQALYRFTSFRFTTILSASCSFITSILLISTVRLSKRVKVIEFVRKSEFNPSRSVQSFSTLSPKPQWIIVLIKASNIGWAYNLVCLEQSWFMRIVLKWLSIILFSWPRLFSLDNKWYDLPALRAPCRVPDSESLERKIRIWFT